RADFSRDRDSRGNGKAGPGHLREICPFAAEERLHVSGAVRASTAEIINKLRCLRFSAGHFGFNTSRWWECFPFIGHGRLKRGTAETNGRKAKCPVPKVSTNASTQAPEAWPPAPRTSPIAAVKSFNPVLGTM